MRQHIANGRRENALSSVYSHLDRSAYWRSEADRVKAGLQAAEDEALRLRQEVASLKNKLENRPASLVKKRKKPDEDVILVPRSPKKSRRAGSPERVVQTALGEVIDVEFSQAGEIGMSVAYLMLPLLILQALSCSEACSTSLRLSRQHSGPNRPSLYTTSFVPPRLYRKLFTGKSRGS